MSYSPSKLALVVMISSAVLLRLPSICERVARALRAKGHKVLVLDGSSLADTQEFEHNYKNNRIKADVVIVQNSFYVVKALATGAASQWHKNSIRPHLSYCLQYSDALYDSWQKTGLIDPVAMAGLSARAFGTFNHSAKIIDHSDNEIFVCGQIIRDVVNWV